MTKSSSLQHLCAVLLFFVATSITSDSQTFKTLANLSSETGVDPQASLVQGRDGNFYGTTPEEGSGGAGTVFKITRAGKLTTIYNFCSLANCADGSAPGSALVLAPDGTFYGTTSLGGASQAGTIFKASP